MTDSKKGFIPLQQGVVLSKKDNPSTREQREYMSKIPAENQSKIGRIFFLCYVYMLLYLQQHIYIRKLISDRFDLAIL